MDGSNPNQTNRYATTFYEGDPMDDPENAEDVITLSNTETVQNTRTVKEQCHSTGQGDHVAAACKLFFNWDITFSSEKRLLGREVMIKPDGCGLKGCNLYFSRSEVLTLVQEEMQ
jgi:hypothetical protein